MYICVRLSHFAVQQKLAQHCKSTILQLKKNIHPRRIKRSAVKTNIELVWRVNVLSCFCSSQIKSVMWGLSEKRSLYPLAPPPTPLHPNPGTLASAHHVLCFPRAPITSWLLFSPDIPPLPDSAACNTMNHLPFPNPGSALGFPASGTLPFLWVFTRSLLASCPAPPSHAHNPKLSIDLMTHTIGTPFS